MVIANNNNNNNSDQPPPPPRGTRTLSNNLLNNNCNQSITTTTTKSNTSSDTSSSDTSPTTTTTTTTTSPVMTNVLTTNHSTPPPPRANKLGLLFSRLQDQNFTLHHLHLTRADLALSEHLKKLDLKCVRHVLQFYDFSVFRNVVLPIACQLPMDMICGQPVYKHSEYSALSGGIQPLQNVGQLMDHYMIYPSTHLPDLLIPSAKKDLSIESIYNAEHLREKSEFDYLFERPVTTDQRCHILSTKHMDQRLVNLVNIDTPFDYQMRLFKEQGLVNRLDIYGKSLKAMITSINSQRRTEQQQQGRTFSKSPSNGNLPVTRSGSSSNLLQSPLSVQKFQSTTTDSPKSSLFSTPTTATTNIFSPPSDHTAEYYDEYHHAVQGMRDNDFQSDFDINTIEEVQMYLYQLRKMFFISSLIKNLYGAKKSSSNNSTTHSTQSTFKDSKKENVTEKRDVGLVFPTLSLSTMSHNSEQHIVIDLLSTVPHLISLSRVPTYGMEQFMRRELFFKSVQNIHRSCIDWRLLPQQVREGTFDGQLSWKKMDYFENFSNETCSLLAKKCNNLVDLTVSGTVFLDTKVQKDVNMSQIPPSRVFNESGLLEVVQHCKNLQRITFRMGKWDPKATNQLLAKGVLPHLNLLDVPGSNFDESTFKAIAANNSLKHLVISNCEVCNDQNLKQLYGHSTIQKLVLQNCQAIQNGLYGLVEANASALTHLELINLHNVNDGFLEAFTKNKSITTLMINHCRTITTQNVAILAKTQHSINHLMIRGTTDSINLSSIGSSMIASQLQVLDLSKTSFPYTQILKSEGPVTAFQPVYYPVVPVSTEDYKQIVNSCRQLRILRLDCNHNVDDSVIQLLSEQTHPNLEELTLEKTSVTVKGINHLCAHFSSPASNLQTLNLRIRTFGEMNMLDQIHKLPKLREIHLGLVRSHTIALHYVKKLSQCNSLDTIYVEFDSLEAKHKLVENNKIKNIFFEL
ncbi:hypothetical protein FDP41_001995 [Naegleria fowleri]|uniref:Uncharacterized protein n=1 Tax=Naegleria fowleri TaxID=5763 RepID=A0A6A5C043_NAEFO|nr:uncharacterized protein FDP41_001995 [Naegleria fowleri]KAF0978925.1 hypothetical protein FDP41_001995 [Naegleria fowleri]CAG4718135.1 unnamed protein product [Naegleria fowleri]